tara:strand:- start:1814 stop:1993 length:180 start_codon:yes stop_codon:yes gene_type:complete
MSEHNSKTKLRQKKISKKKLRQLAKLGFVIPSVEQERIELIQKCEEIEDKIMDLSERYR